MQNLPRSDLDGLVKFRANASGPEASRCAGTIGPGSGRTQPARYQLPTFRPGCSLPQTARTILCKSSPDPHGGLVDSLRLQLPVYSLSLSLAGAAAGIILSRQKFCRNKRVFVATSIVLSRQKTCFVATKMVLVAAPANDMSQA